jgi:hypothetical protein
VLLQTASEQRARSRGVDRGVGYDLGGVEEQLLAPHQAGLKTHLYDALKETPEDRKTVALADAGQGGMVGQRLEQVVA